MDTTAAVQALRATLDHSLCIMGHHYQNDTIVRHCDITGDSLELARRIPDIEAEHIVFCGVYFMGESAALLTRAGQKVYMPAPDADCDMSLMCPADKARLVMEQLKSTGRHVVPLAYVNTTLALKAVVGEYGGAVCTSANAETMLRWALAQGDSVLFLPDRNLGRNMARKLGIPPEEQYQFTLGEHGLSQLDDPGLKRRLLLWPGYCFVHDAFSPRHIEAMRKAHPHCTVLAHPECRPETIAACDGAGSTSFLIKEAARLAEEAAGSTLIIGTETNLVDRLSLRHKGSCTILPLGEALCPDMAKVTEAKLLALLQDIQAGKAVPLKLEEAQCPPARASLTRMLEVCRK